MAPIGASADRGGVMDDRDSRSFAGLGGHDERRFVSLCYFAGLALGLLGQFVGIQVTARLTPREQFVYWWASVNVPGVACLLIGVALLGWGWSVQSVAAESDGPRNDLPLRCFSRGLLCSLAALPFVLGCLFLSHFLPEGAFAL
jgi:hypothetical protein